MMRDFQHVNLQTFGPPLEMLYRFDQPVHVRVTCQQSSLSAILSQDGNAAAICFSRVRDERFKSQVLDVESPKRFNPAALRRRRTYAWLETSLPAFPFPNGNQLLKFLPIR